MYAIVSNNGMWCADSVGVVGVLKDHRDFRAFCDTKERLKDQSVPPSIHTIDEDQMSSVTIKHELNEYYTGVRVEMIVFPDQEDPHNNTPNVYFLISY